MPASRQQPQSSPDPCRKAQLAAQPERILVADDEHLVAAGLASNLEDLGFEVLGPASNGQEAVDLCREDAPDLALLDIHMPERDGLSAADELFSDLGIPVVMFSAYSTPEYVEGGREAGVFGYMLKPVTQDQLRAGITIAWGRFCSFVEQNGEIASLTQRLADRKVIESAKWVLVQKRGMTEPEAQRTLQQQARNSRKTIREVANTVLENESLFGDSDAE